MRIMRTPRLALAGALLALTGLTVACSGSSAETATSSGSPSPSAVAAPDAFPVTVTGANGSLTLDKAPEKIVSMGPTLTEMLFAVGAGAQVVAADDNSNYPSDAPKTDLSAFQPNAEAVATYAPDLVLVNSDSNGLVAALETLNIPALVLEAPTTLDGAYEQIGAGGHGDGPRR